MGRVLVTTFFDWNGRKVEAQDITRLSAQVDAWITEHGALHAYLIAGHGLYTWARDLRHTAIQIEALEFMFECELLLRRIGS